MNTQAETELKQLVERELQVYDKFDQGKGEFMNAIVHGVLLYTDVAIGYSLMNFTPKMIATFLPKDLQ